MQETVSKLLFYMNKYYNKAAQLVTLCSIVLVTGFTMTSEFPNRSGRGIDRPPRVKLRMAKQALREVEKRATVGSAEDQRAPFAFYASTSAAECQLA